MSVSRKSGDIWSDKRYSMVKRSLKLADEGRNSTIDRDALDKESVITKDRLQKFNEIQGTVAGDVEDEIEAAEARVAADGEDDFERADDPAGEYQLQGADQA